MRRGRPKGKDEVDESTVMTAKPRQVCVVDGNQESRELVFLKGVRRRCASDCRCG